MNRSFPDGFSCDFPATACALEDADLDFFQLITPKPPPAHESADAKSVTTTTTRQLPTVNEADQVTCTIVDMAKIPAEMGYDANVSMACVPYASRQNLTAFL